MKFEFKYRECNSLSWQFFMTWSGGSGKFEVMGSLKRSLRGVYGHSLLAGGQLRKIQAETAVIVAFHRVNNDLRDGLTCSTRKFSNFCRFFKQNFDVVALPELITSVEAGKSVEGKLVITFDDGYRDNFLNAAPLLKQLGLPATFFVTTGFIDNSNTAWWDNEASPKPEWMSWVELKQLFAESFSIGAHTVSHADLGSVSLSDASVEITQSKRDIEAILKSTVDLFAYPYGGENNITEETRGLVKSSNFRCCLSCHGGLVKKDSDPFHLSRVPISPWQTKPEHFIVDLKNYSKRP
ncbi:polysaccharide deacetylase family protein [Allohahella sp. A8]|uniref:polysaccharide deacetylase family protein n=1 Tax=Allohahella sp. A8 TaxID=3141461 RepID=UPI003A8073F7